MGYGDAVETRRLGLTEWFGRRHRALHMTIRDIDLRDFDVAGMLERYRSWGVTLFSFFAGGYVTTYPTRLAWQRVPRELGGRDLCGEILAAAREAGICCFPMIDLGEIPTEIAERHPDWGARQADGGFFVKSDGIVTSCPLGGYVRECSRELVGELVERYGAIDGIKWGGASYGFAPGVCHCPTCAERYPAETGMPLPEDQAEPTYEAWRQAKIRETVRYLADVVHEVAGIPVVGNSVWHLGRGMSLAEMAGDQDFTQVEIQTRTYPTGDDGDPGWDRFSTPIETTRYVSGLTPRAPWVVASYFLAWPWRWVAVPWQEQKLYLAQVAANGGCPMVNLTTGAPAQHYDPRGFRAIEELYGFMERNEALYEGDASAACIALVYDHASARAAKERGRLGKDYLQDLHGCEEVLDRWHLPYDLVDSARLPEVTAGRYAAILLPSPAELSGPAIAALERLRKSGTGIVVTGFPPEGLEALLGARSEGAPRPSLAGRQIGPLQAYARVALPEHPLLQGIDAPVVAIATAWKPVQPVRGSKVLLQRAAPFRLFPEGLSFPDEPDPAEPLLVTTDPNAAGRTAWFPIAAGRVARRTGHPDNERLIAQAVTWAARGRTGLHCTGAPDLRLSLRRLPGALTVHAINTAGRDRYRTAFQPLVEIPIEVESADPITRVVLHDTARRQLPFTQTDGRARFVLPELVDYAVIELRSGT